MDTRTKRRFVALGPEESLLNRIDKTTTPQEVSQLLVKVGICDCCNFLGANFKTSVMLAKVVVKISCRFPRIRSRFCFVGTKAGYILAMQDICNLNRAVIRQFKVDGICPDKQLISIAGDTLIMIDNTKYNGLTSNVLAQAFSIYGLFDALIIDESDFNGLGYMQLCTNLFQNELTRHTPKGCGNPEAVIYHECGHLLDFLCRASDDPWLTTYFTSFTPEQLARELSSYAATDVEEFLAEGFAEYMCNPSPRPVARELYDFLTKKYRCL